jgi:glycosyltransferase involved in cell wall biosynthesis
LAPLFDGIQLALGERMRPDPGPLTTALVVPCYNEEMRLPVGLLADWLRGDPAAHLLFVNDGSTDRTRDRIDTLVASAGGRASALHLARNGGKAEAVRQGMLALMERGYATVGFWDADLATPLDAIPGFVEVLASRADIDWVFGARVQLLGRHIARQPLRHYLGRVFATMTSLALGLAVYDTQCGAKLFRASSELARVLATPFMSRWIFEVEMIARLAAGRAPGDRAVAERIYELPLVRWTDVKGSKVKPTDFVRAAGELARIRLTYAEALRASRRAVGRDRAAVQLHPVGAEVEPRPLP